MVPREVELGQLCLGVRQAFINNAAVEVGTEQAHVQHQQGHIRGDAELARLQNVVPVPQPFMQPPLGLVHGEALELARLVFYPVQVFQPPELAGQDRLPRQTPRFRQMFMVFHIPASIPSITRPPGSSPSGHPFPCPAAAGGKRSAAPAPSRDGTDPACRADSFPSRPVPHTA